MVALLAVAARVFAIAGACIHRVILLFTRHAPLLRVPDPCAPSEWRLGRG